MIADSIKYPFVKASPKSPLVKIGNGICVHSNITSSESYTEEEIFVRDVVRGYKKKLQERRHEIIIITGDATLACSIPENKVSEILEKARDLSREKKEEIIAELKKLLIT